MASPRACTTSADDAAFERRFEDLDRDMSRYESQAQKLPCAHRRTGESNIKTYAEAQYALLRLSIVQQREDAILYHVCASAKEALRCCMEAHGASEDAYDALSFLPVLHRIVPVQDGFPHKTFVAQPLRSESNVSILQEQRACSAVYERRVFTKNVIEFRGQLLHSSGHLCAPAFLGEGVRIKMRLELQCEHDSTNKTQESHCEDGLQKSDQLFGAVKVFETPSQTPVHFNDQDGTFWLCEASSYRVRMRLSMNSRLNGGNMRWYFLVVPVDVEVSDDSRFSGIEKLLLNSSWRHSMTAVSLNFQTHLDGNVFKVEASSDRSAVNGSESCAKRKRTASFAGCKDVLESEKNIEESMIEGTLANKLVHAAHLLGLHTALEAVQHYYEVGSDTLTRSARIEVDTDLTFAATTTAFPANMEIPVLCRQRSCVAVGVHCALQGRPVLSWLLDFLVTNWKADRVATWQPPAVSISFTLDITDAETGSPLSSTRAGRTPLLAKTGATMDALDRICFQAFSTPSVLRLKNNMLPSMRKDHHRICRLNVRASLFKDIFPNLVGCTQRFAVLSSSADEVPSTLTCNMPVSNIVVFESSGSEGEPDSRSNECSSEMSAEERFEQRSDRGEREGEEDDEEEDAEEEEEQEEEESDGEDAEEEDDEEEDEGKDEEEDEGEDEEDDEGEDEEEDEGEDEEEDGGGEEEEEDEGNE